MANKLSQKQINETVKLVNEWFDSQNYLDDPDDILHKWLNQPNYFPEGHPWFKPDFEWSGEKVPSFLFEGCMIENWANELCEALNDKLAKKLGVHLEPYSSWAVSIYKW